MLIVTIFVLVVFAYSLLSHRLESTVITAPIVFTVAGALLVLVPEAGRELFIDRKAFLLIAEIGLVMTLFTDASRIRRRALQGDRNLPVRLLTTGMLLTIAARGGGRAGLLRRTVVVGSRHPRRDPRADRCRPRSDHRPQPTRAARIRQALNVEAGLNDGLSVPFLMLFMAFAAALTKRAGAHACWRNSCSNSWATGG